MPEIAEYGPYKHSETVSVMIRPLTYEDVSRYEEPHEINPHWYALRWISADGQGVFNNAPAYDCLAWLQSGRLFFYSDGQCSGPHGYHPDGPCGDWLDYLPKPKTPRTEAQEAQLRHQRFDDIHYDLAKRWLEISTEKRARWRKTAGHIWTAPTGTIKEGEIHVPGMS